MSNQYKVRAYCSSRVCEYVHKEDVMVAINYETAYSLAQLYNEFPSNQAVLLWRSMAFYAHSVIEEPWLT